MTSQRWAFYFLLSSFSLYFFYPELSEKIESSGPKKAKAPLVNSAGPSTKGLVFSSESILVFFANDQFTIIIYFGQLC